MKWLILTPLLLPFAILFVMGILLLYTLMVFWGRWKNLPDREIEFELETI